MSKFTCLVMCIVALSLNKVDALTEEEKAAFRKDIEPIITECSQAQGISKDELKSAKEAGSADAIPACFLGCVFKKIGLLNAEGVYDVQTGLKTVQKYVKNPEDEAKFEEVGKICASVNDQAVGDGVEGCERAKLLLTCVLENKAEVPL